MQPDHWLPLTEYALRSGMSISTLRRKIKSNTIEYKMEEGRYLIRSDELSEAAFAGYQSSDVAGSGLADSEEEDMPDRVMLSTLLNTPKAGKPDTFGVPQEIMQLRQEMQQIRDDATRLQDQDALRWRALETRVAGLAKKLDLFAEQFAELKMLVKIFEEKLDRRA